MGKQVLMENRVDVTSSYQGGESLNSIGKRYGCKGETVSRYLKELGVKLRKSTAKTSQEIARFVPQILKLFDGGKSIEEISRELEISASSITRILKENERDTSRYSNQPKNDELIRDEQKILERYQTGESCAKIAKTYNCTYQTISKFLQQRGVEIRKIRKVSEYHDEIVRMHDEGESLYGIAKKLGFANYPIQKYAKKIGLDTSRYNKNRDDLLQNYKEEIIEKYMKGIGCYTLANEYNVAESSILRLLKNEGIQTRPLRILGVNESYFEKIDTEDKAFFY